MAYEVRLIPPLRWLMGAVIPAMSISESRLPGWERKVKPLTNVGFYIHGLR